MGVALFKPGRPSCSPLSASICVNLWVKMNFLFRELGKYPSRN
jgi:hypothetical protein